MTENDLDQQIPAIAPGHRFQWEQAQDRWVILFPEGMIQLSPSAAEILKRCSGALSTAAIIEDLQQQFPGADLGNDVRQFLRTAQEKGWIRFKAHV